MTTLTAIFPVSGLGNGRDRVVYRLAQAASSLSKGLFELPEWFGLWPAALGIFAFTWLELVAPDRATLPVLQTWIALYVVVPGRARVAGRLGGHKH